jgi:predicted ATPase/DNA-binding CsgD family transcriptional regulator/DNA-binding XRE family transcriptional regulator
VNSEPPEAVSFAARLRMLRARLGLSQEQLARRLGVSFATVNRWETGRSQPSARARAAIAELESPAQPGRAQQPAQGQEAAEEQTPRLPIAQSSFVGRERELAALSELLTRSRLINLIGPGGVGKTRLAIEAARRWAARGGLDGEVVFVPLEAIQPPRPVISMLASRLGLRERPGVSWRELALAALRGRPGLLLLDGAEHYREEVAGLAGEFLASAPGLGIVVTSRVVLGVPGEVCWAVPPLDCPSVTAGAREIAASDAVRLFIARAGDRLPGFSAADVPPHAVGELCRRLGGLPLAIELIAGWVGTLSVREILEQRVTLLEYDSPGAPGSRKLADVLRASYDLLPPGQQRTLRLLSVFNTPFSLAEVQAVTGVGEQEVAAVVRALVDASWLVVTRGLEQNRFSMVEAIREFATARLQEAGEAAQAHRRHARHFADVAIASPSSLAGPDAHRWAARLTSAVDDLRAMMQWVLDNGETDLGVEVGAALWRWWLTSGRLTAGRAWLGKFLAAADERPARTAVEGQSVGRALGAAAVLAAESGDYAEAVRLARQAMRIFEPLAPGEDLAFAATVLGSAQRYLGERAEARRSLQIALDVRAAVGDRAKLAMAVNNMALVEIDDGNLDRARELLEQNLIIKRQLGEPRSIAIGLLNLADVLIRDGRWQAARGSLAEAAELAVGQPELTGLILCGQGNLEAKQRNWKQAAERYADAVAASGIGGHTHDVIEAMIGLGRARHELGQADEATRQLRTAEAMAHEIANPQLLAQVTEALAETSDGAADPLPGNLTVRQAEVLRLLADGLSNRQIAARLYLSPGTVERHLATIYRKLGLGGRVDAARYAVEHGLTERALDRADLRGQALLGVLRVGARRAAPARDVIAPRRLVTPIVPRSLTSVTAGIGVTGEIGIVYESRDSPLVCPRIEQEPQMLPPRLIGCRGAVGCGGSIRRGRRYAGSVPWRYPANAVDLA